MNREYSTQIIQKLLTWGVEEFYVCAGARDFPLIEAAYNIKSEKKIVFNHFEERSAAFYALGRIKSLQKPVAIITTSGTAVGELLPATMEAYYSGLPLVLVTADRPQSYRGTGAPQSAEQKNIFGTYVSHCFDITPAENFNLSNIPKNKPLHINVCFDIPIQSGQLTTIHKSEFSYTHITSERKSEENKFKLEKFINNSKNLLVIVSQLHLKENKNIINFLKYLNAPIYIESISNIREVPELEHLRIKCADKIWANSKKGNYIIDSVLKIGGTPTHRFWRDLDETYKHIKVLSISDNLFSGMPNAEHISADINLLLSEINLSKNKNNDCLKLDNDCYLRMKELFYIYPEAEQSIFYHLSNEMVNNSRVYLGNSLPIRYWDLAASFENKNLYIDASRGLNGIDGQISTFLGFADEFLGFPDELSPENWGIFGDLTTLYDLAGMWMLQHRPQLKTNIVVMNNNGGRIFNTVLKGEISFYCQNMHNLNFEGVAMLWGLHYEKVNQVKQISQTKQNRIIEVRPNEEQTELFSNRLLQI